MPSRFEYERGIRRSSLLPPSRHLALTIATWADAETGVIPIRFQPSLTTLTEATGLDRSTVRRHLTRLEKEGWVVRERPDPVKARTEHARTGYRLAIPLDADLGEDAGARGTQPPALGAHSPQPGGTQPLGLGAHSPMARGTQPPKSSLSSVSAVGAPRVPQPAPGNHDGLHPLPEDFTLTDAMRRWSLQTFGPAINVDHETSQFVSHFRAEGTRKKSWPDAWQKWMRNAAKYAAERQQRPALRAVAGGTPEDRGIF